MAFLGTFNKTLDEVPLGEYTLHLFCPWIGREGHVLKVFDLGDNGSVALNGEGDHVALLGDMINGIIIEHLVPSEQAGLGEVIDACHPCSTGERIVVAVYPDVVGT